LCDIVEFEKTFGLNVTALPPPPPPQAKTPPLIPLFPLQNFDSFVPIVALHQI
jgi:hypothetical protein